MKPYHQINLKPVNGFDITLEALDENGTIEGTMDDEILEEILPKIQSGELQRFCAKVSVSIDGIVLGTDYLGECIYKDLEDFSVVEADGYLSDMIETAIDEAKNNLAFLAKKFNETQGI